MCVPYGWMDGLDMDTHAILFCDLATNFLVLAMVESIFPKNSSIDLRLSSSGLSISSKLLLDAPDDTTSIVAARGGNECVRSGLL